MVDEEEIKSLCVEDDKKVGTRWGADEYMRSVLGEREVGEYYVSCRRVADE